MNYALYVLHSYGTNGRFLTYDKFNHSLPLENADSPVRYAQL